MKTTDILPVARVVFFWAAKWDTSALPNGSYQLWCVVRSVEGSNR